MRHSHIAIIAALVPALAWASPQAQGDQGPQGQDQPSEQEPEQPATPDMHEMTANQGQLGIMIMGITPELRTYFGAPMDSGLLVGKVASNSPASRAGVRVGDVITKVGDKKIQNASDVQSTLSAKPQNQKVAIEVVRDHKTVQLQAMLGKNQQQGTDNKKAI